MNSMAPYFNGCIFLSSCFLTYLSFKHSKAGSFFGDTAYWFWLGVYVWGDGLVLGPFWAFSSLVWYLLPVKTVLVWILLFFILRSFYEVMFWLMHQFARKEYRPPVLRNVPWLNAESAGILYQVFHTCVVVVCLVCLFIVITR
jgi:hypothetical protein